MRKRLKELEQESLRLKAAIAAVTAVERGGEIVAREKANGRTELALEAPQRRYTYKYTAKCHRCGKEFATARIVRAGTKRPHQFCHQPCTSELDRKDRAEKARAERGQTLFAGDALSGAAH